MLRQIGRRYTLGEAIGRGAMGVVYRAEDRLTGQPVALKQVQVAPQALSFASRGSSARQALHVALGQEFRTLSGLRHPNIISVLDYGFDRDGQPFFTMDLLTSAQTIVAYGAGKPLMQQAGLIVQVLQALTYLHRHNILHRDLKPENILVTPDGVPRLLDFGLAAEASKAKEVVGTLAYMAPETLQHEHTSITADLYTAGLIAYEMFTGRYPYPTGTPTALIRHILETLPDLSVISSPQLAAVMARWLAKDPTDRYQQADETLDALCSALEIAPPQESVTIRESFLQAAPFVGREAELAQLHDALRQVESGSGSVWLIGGESGAGKSRLVDELQTLALVEGIAVLRGQAVEGAPMPYALWRDLVPHLLLHTNVSDQEASILKAIAPEVRRLVGRPVADAPALDGLDEARRLAFTLGDLLLRLPMPTLLVLEDLHWMPDSERPIIEEIMRVAAQRALLVTCTYRTEEAPDLPQAISGAHTLTLDRLDRRMVAALAVAMIGESGKHPDVVNLLFDETEGNLLFLVEAVRALAEERGTLASIERKTLPESILTGSVQALMQRRLDRVPPAYQPALGTAAISGRSIDLALMAHIHPDLDLQNWLYTCAQVAVLEPRDGRWRFSHDKLREVALASLEPTTKADRSAAVAAALETLHPDDKRLTITLARLWHEAGNIERTLHYVPTASERAAISHSYAQARRILAIGLENTAAGSREYAFFTMRDASIQIRQGQLEAAKQRLYDALQMAESYDDRELRVDCHIWLTRCCDRLNQFDEARKHALLAIDESQPGTHHAISAHRSMASIALRQGFVAEAREYIEQTLRHLEAKPEPHLKVQVMGVYGWVQISSDEPEQARATLEEAAEIARQLGLADGYASMLINLSNALIVLGELERAHAHLTEVRDIMQRIGNRHHEAVALGLLGEIALHRDEPDHALSHQVAALAIRKEINDIWGMAFSYIGLGDAHYALSDLTAAAYHYREAETTALKGDMRYQQAQARVRLGFVRLAEGDQSQAEALFHAGLEEDVFDPEMAFLGLCNLDYARGHYERAAELAGWLDAQGHKYLMVRPFLSRPIDGLPGLDEARQRGAALDVAAMKARALSTIDHPPGGGDAAR